METPKHNGLNFGLKLDENFGGVFEGGYVDIYQFPKLLDGSKDWLTFPSEREIQKTHFIDIMDCTVEAIINAYHIFIEYLKCWDIKVDNEIIFPTKNLSQRFNAKDSGVTPSGNTTENADNSVKNSGVCDEKYWHRTADMTWNDYYSVLTNSVRNQAKKSTKVLDFNAYRISNNHQIMMDALDRGLLAVIGYAWEKGNNGLYQDFGYSPNHRFLVVGYVKGEKWIVRDSYPTDYLIDNDSTDQEFVKELDWNYNFGEIKLIIITPTETSKKKIYLNLLNKPMKNFYYYWDGTHNFYYVGVPSGETKKFRQYIDWDNMSTELRFAYLAMRDSMNKSSWAEISRFADISTVNKKFA